MGQNSGYKNCGGCEFSLKIGLKQLVCRRYPPIGKIAQTHGGVIGTQPRQAYVSFYPPIQLPMWCGEWKATTKKAGVEETPVIPQLLPLKAASEAPELEKVSEDG